MNIRYSTQCVYTRKNNPKIRIEYVTNFIPHTYIQMHVFKCSCLIHLPHILGVSAYYYCTDSLLKNFMVFLLLAVPFRVDKNLTEFLSNAFS